MANVTVSITGLRAITNPSAWGTGAAWGKGSWNTGGSINAQNIAFNSEGWGRNLWSQGDWGRNGLGVTIPITGQSFSSSVGSTSITAQLNVGWGRKTWGNLGWGVAYSAAPAGLPISVSIGGVTVKANALTPKITNTITSGLGLVDISGDGIGVHVNANPVTLSTGSPVVTNFETVSLSGVQITSAVNPATTPGSADVSLTGQQINVGFGSTFRAFTDITIRPTGFSISSGLGSVEAISKVDVSGFTITSSLGNITTKQTAVIKPTGLGITSGLGLASAIAWGSVDTGSTVSYSEVNTGSQTTWTDIAA
tara:strand:- start:2206 stop:3132 length:927 start_codon:yes stop_codon:yes gene_type:complete